MTRRAASPRANEITCGGYGPVNKPHLLVHHRADNVGVVVVEGLTAGTEMLCVVTEDNSDFRLTAKDDIPIGHKVALQDFAPGDTAMKYGEDIGRFVGTAE